jgi:tRNA-dihydrouridine synthase B
MLSLWQKLPKPIIGLSPMDGITDYAFREIHAKYGKPAVMLTEFTNVEGMFLGKEHLFTDLLYSPIQRPIIAQIFGSTPDYFYKAAIVCCELGFDGIDINMGCPAKNVAHLGGGAALIGKPELAKQIIRSVQQGVSDWVNGKQITELELDDIKLNKIAWMKTIAKVEPNQQRNSIPVSVKTRLGIDDSVIEEWVKHLLETEPANITIHGRTLKQMYTGTANWDEIAKAAKIIKQTQTTILGNGDTNSLEDAHNKVITFGVDGVLIGRTAMGNPYLWNKLELAPAKKLELALEHAKIHTEYKPEKLFLQMRKHFSFYVSNFYNSSEIKIKLLQSKSLEEVEPILIQEIERLSQLPHSEFLNVVPN